ncbi:MAG: hypothetical protein HGN29_11375 [Asgard group archaeon]|nr:hypothetical protein [Asgard group archaeon]
MILEIISGIYALIVGAGMIGIWIILLITKQVPEIKTAPIDISLHITAEYLTGLLSILSGILLLVNITWAGILFIVSLGMVIYAVINAGGYYGQKKEWSFVILFGVLFISAVILLIFNILQIV